MLNVFREIIKITNKIIIYYNYIYKLDVIFNPAFLQYSYYCFVRPKLTSVVNNRVIKKTVVLLFTQTRDVISMFQCGHEKKKIKLHLLSCTVVRKSIVGMNRETVTASFQILVLHVYFTYNIRLNTLIYDSYYFHTGET